MSLTSAERVNTTDLNATDINTVDVYTMEESSQVSLARSLLDPHDLTRRLVALHGARVVGRLAGYQDPKIAYRWLRPSGSVPSNEALRRLYAAHRIWSEVRGQRTHEQALAWFLAPHPLLNEQQPLQLMIDGGFSDVSAVTALPQHPPFHHPRIHSAASSSVKPTSSIGPITALWHEASLLPLREVAKAITSRFGARMAASIAGESNPKVAYRWARNEGKLPVGESARRLYAMCRVVISFDASVTEPIARAWFRAANPSLDELSPLDAAREGKFHAITHAADQFLLALNYARSVR